MNPSERSKYEPLTWLLMFRSSTNIWWVDRLVPGRFKHVMAFGWVEETKAWISYDVQLGRTCVLTMPEDDGAKYYARLIGDDPGCGVLRVPANADGKLPLRAGFWCVPAIKHLVGLRSGALRPDALWRDCLGAGAEIIHELRVIPPTISAECAGSRGAEGG